MPCHKSFLSRILAVFVAIAWVAVVSIPGASAAGPAVSGAASPVVHTDKGAVQGATTAGVDRYLGIRYAKPPVGALRWQPPQPAAVWPGVQQTAAFGSSCPQNPNSSGLVSVNEDCLFVNVWRPAGTSSAAGLPVYVFVHGGGLTIDGSSHYDGTNIVQQTGVIVVDFNYRLGVFGFLGLPALTAQQRESGNYGLQDQIAALAWVHRNIAAFGGNPGRVTIGGESSGAISVCALLTAPGAAGLFSAAMMESGFCGNSGPYDSSTQNQFGAETIGQFLAGQLGCPVAPATSVLACMRAMDVQTLLNGWDNVSNIFGDPSLMVVGTKTLPLDPHLAVLQGKFRHVPILIGANRDEGRGISAVFVGTMDKAGYETWLQNVPFAPGQGAAIEARYPWPAASNQFTGAYLGGAVLTDGWWGIGGCPTRDLANSLAKNTTTYVYEFDNRTGPGPSSQPVGYMWGASHFAEMAYLWPLASPWETSQFTAVDRQLSKQMLAYWGAFIKNGNPAATGQPSWPSLNSTPQFMSLRAGNTSTMITTAAFYKEHQCNFWG